VPTAKENHVNLELPDIASAAACGDAQARIITAVANGEILPSEGNALSILVENRRRAIETVEIEVRILALEERMAK
jgi:hypothetical protein